MREITKDDFFHDEKRLRDFLYLPNGELNPRIAMVGDKCHKCGKTANLPHGPGWFCVCGHYIIMGFSSYRPTFEKPDLGPPRALIIMVIRGIKSSADRFATIRSRMQTLFLEKIAA